MKTDPRKSIESRFFIPAIALLYLLLAALLLGVIGLRQKHEIEALLTQWIPRFLWANFLLIAVGAVLCRRDIAEAFRELFALSPRPGPVPPNSPPLAGGDEEGRGNAFRRLLNRPGVSLLLILIAGLLLVMLVAPRIHRIYYDEDIYANMAQNIAYTGQTGMANWGSFEYGEYFVNWLLYNKDPSGWPFLMSLAFLLLGTDETHAFILNNLLFAAGILVAFFIARVVFGGRFAGLTAALLYALIPHNLIWSNTLAAETSAALFGGLAVLCTLVWLRSREARHLFLTAAIMPFACAMRPESALIVFWAFAAATMNLFGTAASRPDAIPQGGRETGINLPRHPFATRIFWAAGLVAFALAIPHVWHFYAMGGQSWGAEGVKFSTGFFLNNLAVNGLYYLDNKEFPLLFTLLAAVGLAAGPGRPEGRLGKGSRLPLLLILLWFVLFWGIFLFFYAGSYKYGADVRFALVSFMPLVVLGGGGAEYLRKKAGGLSTASGFLQTAPHKAAGRGKGGGAQTTTVADGESALLSASRRLPVAGLLILILVVFWLKFLPLIRLVGQQAWGARYDHAYAREFVKKIPNRSVVVTHVPTMFLLWGQNAIQAYAGINNPDIIEDLMDRYNGHVYFHRSYWCNTVNDQNRQICDGIAQRYSLEPVEVAREQENEYGLYRMIIR